MRKSIKSILPEVGVGDLKIRSTGDNRCESAKYGGLTVHSSLPSPVCSHSAIQRFLPTLPLLEFLSLARLHVHILLQVAVA
jgi:hypothetical protein